MCQSVLSWVATIALTNTELLAVISDEKLIEALRWKWRAQFNSDGSVAVVRCTSHRNGQVSLQDYVMGAPPDGKIWDHIDGQPLNNLASNLRAATNRENSANRRKGQTRAGQPHSSAFKGVNWHKRLQRWRAYVRHNGQQTFLGYYDDPVEAARAYNEKAKELFGEFAQLNAVMD